MAGSDGLPSTAVLQFDIPADLAELRPAVQRIRTFLACNDLSEGEVIDWDLAFVEACTNAIRHAPPNAASQPVGVEVLCHPAEIEMRVTDHTEGFAWPKRAALPDVDQESGRGIFLIQALMDSSDYSSGPAGNVLVMRKKRNSR